MKGKKRTMTATQFKAECLKVLDRLDAEGILITKRGVPVAELRPVGARLNQQLIGCMAGKIKIRGDVFSTGVRWNAQS